MTFRRGALVSFVVAIAVVQVVLEDVIVFLGATGTVGPGTLSSPYLLIGVPFTLFLLLAGALSGWALTGETAHR